MKEEWLSKYRAAILEGNPALQLLRIVEAYGAIQRRLEKLEKNSHKRRKLDNAIKTLDSLRYAHTQFRRVTRIWRAG